MIYAYILFYDQLQISTIPTNLQNVALILAKKFYSFGPKVSSSV